MKSIDQKILLNIKKPKRFSCLIGITAIVIAITICGMTSKRATEIGTPAHAIVKDCCRISITGEGSLPKLPSDARLLRDPNTLEVLSLKAGNLSQNLDDLPCYRNLVAEKRYSEAAVCFFEYYRQIFKLAHPSRELSTVDVRTDDLGLTHVRMRQTHAGISVWPGEITIHFSKERHIYWVQGNYRPTPQGIDPNPHIPKMEALKAAAMAMDRPDFDCSQCKADLVIYTGRSEAPVLSYRVSASAGLDKGWVFFIDAQSGDILHKINSINTISVSPILN